MFRWVVQPEIPDFSLRLCAFARDNPLDKSPTQVNEIAPLSKGGKGGSRLIMILLRYPLRNHSTVTRVSNQDTQPRYHQM